MAITKTQPGSINQPLGSLNQSGVNLASGIGVLEINGLSSDLTVAKITVATVYGSDVAIENATMETDGTGLAGGTNFQMSKDDGIGLANVLAETVANLGANKTVDLSSASLVKQACVIAAGSHLQVNSTVAPCTGAGKWRLTVRYRPMMVAGNMS